MGGQKINLSPPCTYRGTYLHEIGHALGLIHEHNRPDRHNHMKIMWRNVDRDNKDTLKEYRNVYYFDNDYDVSMDALRPCGGKYPWRG
jgi:hypothetical protein